MNIELVNRAKAKLDEEIKSVSGRAEDVMKNAVKDTLIMFCEQSDEFAEAILSGEKTFSDCMKKVAANHGSGISDIEAYRRAVAFYMDGAEVEFTMTVNLPGKNNITFVNFTDLI